MTNSLKNPIKKRVRAHDRLLSHSNSKNEIRFKQLRNLVTNEVRNARKQYYDQKLALSGSPAQNFKLFKEFLGQRKNSQGKGIPRAKEGFDVEEFYHFFINVGKKVSNTNFHTLISIFFDSFAPWTKNWFLSDRNEAMSVLIFPQKPRFFNLS